MVVIVPFNFGTNAYLTAFSSILQIIKNQYNTQCMAIVDTDVSYSPVLNVYF